MIEIQIHTKNRGLIDITDEINTQLIGKNAKLCNIFCKHTSASIIITGNEDFNLLLDINDFIKKLVPDEGNYRHKNEGDCDASSHIRTLLLGDSKTIPVLGDKLNLGKFQGVFLYEHRGGENTRKIVLTLI